MYKVGQSDQIAKNAAELNEKIPSWDSQVMEAFKLGFKSFSRVITLKFVTFKLKIFFAWNSKKTAAEMLVPDRTTANEIPLIYTGTKHGVFSIFPAYHDSGNTGRILKNFLY